MTLTKNLPKKQPVKKPRPKRLSHEEVIKDLSTLPRYQGTTVPTALVMRPVRSTVAAMPLDAETRQTELDHMDPRFKDLPLPMHWDETWQEHGQMPEELYAEWLYTMERLLIRGVTCSDIRRLSKIPLRDLQPLEKAVRETWALTCTPDKRDALRGELFNRGLEIGNDMMRRLSTIEPDENYAAAASVAKAAIAAQARCAALIGADAPKQDPTQVNVTVATQINPVQHVKESMGIDLSNVDLDSLGDAASELITNVTYSERDAEDKEDT